MPASHILISIGTDVAERLLYLPSVFFVLSVGSGVTYLYRTTSSFVNRLALALTCAGIVLLFCRVSFSYSKAWKSESSLFEYGLQTHPHNVKALINVGLLEQSSNYSRAIRLLEDGIKFSSHPTALINKAFVSKNS